MPTNFEPSPGKSVAGDAAAAAAALRAFRFRPFAAGILSPLCAYSRTLAALSLPSRAHVLWEREGQRGGGSKNIERFGIFESGHSEMRRRDLRILCF